MNLLFSAALTKTANKEKELKNKKVAAKQKKTQCVLFVATWLYLTKNDCLFF